MDSCNGGRAKTSMMTSRSSPAVHLPSSASVMPSGHHPESQSKGEQDAELQKAKQWTYNIQTLKRTIDCLYEICRQEHSVIGCKEALMYLSNSVRDFESLIETINVEVEWEAENKPHAVAWEIRKTMSPPGRSKVDGPSEHAKALINMFALSPVVVQQVVEKNVQQKLNSVSQYPTTVNKDAMDNKENQQKKAASINNQECSDEGWRVVTTRNKRKKSRTASSTTSSSEHPDYSAPPVSAPKRCTTMNVYERLASGVLRPPNPASRPVTPSGFAHNGAKLTCPRSAMDLPQTKASMAKMAYSRQLLWQKHQILLEEKLQKRRRRGFRCERRNDSPSASSSINFADPIAVKRSAEAFKNRRKLKQSLNSDQNNAEAVTNSVPRNIDCIEETPAEDEGQRENIPVETHLIGTDEETVPFSSAKPSLSDYVALPDGIDADEAWRAMTEEEESLVQEEQSLKKEIEEEESLSVDDELERQVAAEAAALEEVEFNQQEKERVAEELETHRMNYANATWQDIVQNWKQEMERYASVSWSEIVDREITRYHKPGELAQVHEKLSSPSRKRDMQVVSRKLEERQQKAEELRHMLQEEKARRLKELSNKVEEVRRKRAELCERKREHLERRMEKAKENRLKNISKIVRKAREDDIKVMEVHFINSMEANNMRHDVIARNLEWEHRMNTLAAERAKKNEEKAAKEAAAEERRKNAEIQRTKRLREQVEKKLARQSLVEAQRIEQEIERATVAKQKQQQYTERLAEKRAIEAAESEKLMKRIIQQQEDTRRRYEETLTQVKQRALELSTPRVVELSSPRAAETVAAFADFIQLPSEASYTSNIEDLAVNAICKKCTLCNRKLESDLSVVAHMLSDDHLTMRNLEASDVSYESLKSDLELYVAEGNAQEAEVDEKKDDGEHHRLNTVLKKRRLRLRQKLIARSKEFDLQICSHETDETNASAVKTGFDRTVREILRLMRVVADEETLSKSCSGIIKERYQKNNSLCHSDIRKLERAIAELHRAIVNVDSAQKRGEMVRCISQSGLQVKLTALVSCASNGDTLVPSRTLCKTLLLIELLVELDPSLLARLFFSTSMLVLIDSFSIKFKLLLSQSTTNAEKVSIKVTNELLMQCYFFSNLLSLLFKRVYANQDESSTSPGGIADSGCTACDDGSRLEMLTSMLVLCGFDDSLSLFIQQYGLNERLPWSVKVDRCDHIQPFLSIVNLLTAFDEALSNPYLTKRVREWSPDSEGGIAPDKNKSIIASVLPGAVRALVYRMYSLLSAESGASMWDRSMTASSNSLLLISDQYDHVSAFYMLTSAFAILFCILARREPNEAKQCVHDSELSLRLVHIFMHCFSRLDSSSSVPSSALSSPLLDSTRSPTLFRQMIFAAGYFASLGSRAQMLCLLGWERSVLMQLCMLPMSYFANPVFTAELMPTLIAICFRNKSAIELIKHTLSPRVLVDFLKDAAEDDVPEISRFPKKLWPEAIEYFNSC